MGYIPPRIPNPAHNPGCFADGKNVFDVEEEAIRLFDAIDASRPKFFQGAWWRLFWLKQKYFPLSVEELKEERRQYLTQEYESGRSFSVIDIF